MLGQRSPISPGSKEWLRKTAQPYMYSIYRYSLYHIYNCPLHSRELRLPEIDIKTNKEIINRIINDNIHTTRANSITKLK